MKKFINYIYKGYTVEICKKCQMIQRERLLPTDGVKDALKWSSVKLGFEDTSDLDLLNRREMCLSRGHRQHKTGARLMKTQCSKAFGGVKSKSVCLIWGKLSRKRKTDRYVGVILSRVLNTRLKSLDIILWSIKNFWKFLNSWDMIYAQQNYLPGSWRMCGGWWGA